MRYLSAVLLALTACNPVPASPLPPSGLTVHIHPTVGMADITSGVLRVTVTVGGPAGTAVGCSQIRVEVDGYLLGSDEPDCSPDDVERDGGAWSRQLGLGPGDHQIEVRATEPGRRPLRKVQVVRVIA